MSEFSAYLDGIEDQQQRERTKAVLDWVGEKFPHLGRRIAWNQPMFTDHGTFIAGFSISKHHLAFAPEPAAIGHFSTAIGEAGYAHSSNLVRLPWNAEVDYALLKRIIEFNILEKADCATFWRKPDKA